MAGIDIDVNDVFTSWFDEELRPVLEESNVRFTDSSREFFRLTLQAQIDDGIFDDPDDVLKNARILSELMRGDEVFGRAFRGRALNINTAIHLVVELNRIAAAFPSDTTD